VDTVSPRWKAQFTTQASGSLQRQIGSDFSLEAGYVFLRAFHVPVWRETNYLPSAAPNPRGPGFGPSFTRASITTVQANELQPTGYLTDHSMTVTLTRSFARSLGLQAGYTLSSSHDDVPSAASPDSFPTIPRLSRGPSDFDVRHRFVASSVLRVPAATQSGALSSVLRDMQLSPWLAIYSGLPFTLGTGADTNGDSHYYDRLLFVERNTGRLPGTVRLNLRVQKTFHLRSDGLRMDWIAEGVNLMNRFNPSDANAVIGPDLNAPDYNRGSFQLQGLKERPPTAPLGITEVLSARQIQVGVRVSF
jgi:hypothetical protein